MGKNFKLTADQIKPLAPGLGSCFATNRITVDGCAVGYAYREKPDFANDSGWRFFSGDESQQYVDDPANTQMYDVNTIANYDPEIIPILKSDPPAAYERPSPGAALRPVR